MKIRFVVLLATMLLGACRTAPVIYQIQNAAVVANVPNPTKEDVRKAIVRAGTGLGWQVADNGPDAMIATLNIRTHVAVVDIPYSAKEYSILYKDSKNLDYNGSKIHKNYNGWIENLQSNIGKELKLI